MKCNLNEKIKRQKFFIRKLLILTSTQDSLYHLSLINGEKLGNIQSCRYQNAKKDLKKVLKKLRFKYQTNPLISTTTQHALTKNYPDSFSYLKKYQTNCLTDVCLQYFKINHFTSGYPFFCKYDIIDCPTSLAFRTIQSTSSYRWFTNAILNLNSVGSIFRTFVLHSRSKQYTLLPYQKENTKSETHNIPHTTNNNPT